MSLCHSFSWLLWCSRKYPYPSHGRFFGLTFSPQSLWKFQFLFLLSFQIILITSLDFTSDLGVTSNIRSLFICKKSVKTKMLIHFVLHYCRLAWSAMSLRLTQLTAVSWESFLKAQCTCKLLTLQSKRRWQRWRSMYRCGFSTSLSGTWIWAWCTTDWERTWRSGWFFSKTSSKGRLT